MQLGCILRTVPSWRKSYLLRVAVFVEYETDVEEERSKVANLLENLRMEAEILVFWLASGDVKSYQVIINGDDSDPEAESQVEKVLEDEDWWKQVRKMRGKANTGDVSAVEELSLADENVGWPSSSLQNLKQDASTMGQDDRLHRLLSRSRTRKSFSNLTNLGISLGMRTHRLNDDMLSRHASDGGEYSSSDSDAVATSSEDSEDHEDENFDASESGASTEMELDSADQPPGSTSHLPRKTHSKKSSLSSKRSRSSKNKLSRPTSPAAEAADLSRFRIDTLGTDQTIFNVGSSDDLLTGRETDPRGRPGIPRDVPEIEASASEAPHEAKVAGNDVGISVMFAEDARALRKRPTERHDGGQGSRGRSIYQRTIESRSPPAGGFPGSASVSLSFNDLPSRAQHLILNELMGQHSDDTAVIFTTLPAPIEGTYKSENDSLGYISDLEVLCGGLPPTLLVNSNSMTVTMNL